MATIDDLIRLAPPPAAPVNATGDWAAVEAALGLLLPADYKILIGRYGLGRFHDIFALTPFDGRNADLAELVTAAKGLGRVSWISE